MRVHASPSLNKRVQDGDNSSGVVVRPGQSPVKQAMGQSSPQTNTVQDTDDRIAKDSIYGTIRMKRREAANNEELARVEEDVDSLPPPPVDDGCGVYDDARNLSAPKPAPRKGHNQDVMVSGWIYYKTFLHPLLEPNLLLLLCCKYFLQMFEIFSKASQSI